MNSQPSSIQVRVHYLNENENLENVLFKIQKGSVIEFRLGPSLFGRRVRLFANYPPPTGRFERTEYGELALEAEGGKASDDTALRCRVPFLLAGSFHYFFLIEGSGSDPNNSDGSGYILVDPCLLYGPEKEVLQLGSILCVTYLAKSLGPFPEWEDRLRTAKEIGYNMVHITPIQELGASNSSYSLRNQLKLNPIFGQNCTIDGVAELVEKMRVEWKVMTITDIVLNHTANESEWLQEHTDATYNVSNSPHLRPAFLLDRAIWNLSLDIAAGQLANWGVPAAVNCENHINAIRNAFGTYREKIKLHEFYMMSIESVLQDFKKQVSDPNRGLAKISGDLSIIQDPEFRRFKSTVDLELALSIFAPSKMTNPQDIERVARNLRGKLEELNNAKRAEIENHFNAAIENVLSGARYERLDPSGPRLKVVSAEYPLVPKYFKHPDDNTSLEEDEVLLHSDRGRYAMAHNGWVMGDDPLSNFAAPGSNVYLRRELVCWGDSVKLRYGEWPEDSPFLWQHMTEYVQQLAKAFHGLRLDNCHSTPIHVAEFLIDKAREVRSDLFVIAELFTSSEGVDNVFVNQLGITALIREALQAPDSHEQGRLVYRYGGSRMGAFLNPPSRPLRTGIAHAVFMDMTHDNRCPMEIRSVYDYFPTAAMVSMACCATGSTWGYDELVPHHIHVVSEKRLYTSWTDSVAKRGFINAQSGIIAGKKALNNLHSELGSAGFSQVYVDDRDENTVAITRHNPSTHQSVIMIARTSFRMPNNPKDSYYAKPMSIQGAIEEIILEGCLEPVGHQGTSLGDFPKDEEFIHGLTGFRLGLREGIAPQQSQMVEVTQDHSHCEIDFVHFPLGSVIVLRVSLESEARAAVHRVRSCIAQFGYCGGGAVKGAPELGPVVASLSLADLNAALFRCPAEEGAGAYRIPGYGDLVYCGLQGVMSELMTIHTEDDLGHPLCDHLREGDWLAEYSANRLLQCSSTRQLGEWLRTVFESLKKVPRYLVPCYFDSIVTGVYSALLSAMWDKMSPFVANGSTFVKHLAMGSVILCGIVRSSPLPLLSPNLEKPVPEEAKDENGQTLQNCVTISAGLPHFSTGYMRNWGRDTFISLKGLLLLTGRFQEARYIILAFAGCLRHGLIPNLLDRGVCARFNCRDAVWWWLQSIQDYVSLVPDGFRILSDKVSRIFPTDDSPPQPPGKFDQPLHDVIQESMQKHFQGLKFRERNAGFSLDDQMTHEGFNNEIGVDLETGFVFGGNVWNCGTWMDKMGSSEKAGNKGKPATPRDGSAVEIVGLSKSALRFLNSMFLKGHYPYDRVERHTADAVVQLTWAEWEALVQRSFEARFYVGLDAKAGDSQHVFRRGIYRDSVGASQAWADFQLRPNFPIAMAVAPELFTLENAWTALENAEEHLLGPLGMKTLDPDDWAYDGDYDNSDDSMDQKRAKGWNYHQGPEWLWPVGFFLRARLAFSRGRDRAAVKRTTARHFRDLQASKVRGLPELTNRDGSPCRDSCAVQAWSHATLLEVLHDMDARH